MPMGHSTHCDMYVHKLHEGARGCATVGLIVEFGWRVSPFSAALTVRAGPPTSPHLEVVAEYGIGLALRRRYVWEDTIVELF